MPEGRKIPFHIRNKSLVRVRDDVMKVLEDQPRQIKEEKRPSVEKIKDTASEA